MRTVVAVLAFGAVAVTPWAGQAQPLREASRVSIEVLVDGAFPTSKLGLAELDAGLGMGANVRVRLQPHLLAYAGWEWHKFATEELVASQAVDVEDTGYTFGVRFEQPFRGESATTSAPGYWLRAGGMWNHLEIEDDEGEIIADTGHGLGWEAGAGVTFPLGSRLAFASRRSLSHPESRSHHRVVHPIRHAVVRCGDGRTHDRVLMSASAAK